MLKEAKAWIRLKSIWLSDLMIFEGNQRVCVDLLDWAIPKSESSAPKQTMVWMGKLDWHDSKPKMDVVLSLNRN
jgi:hypothetical protein